MLQNPKVNGLSGTPNQTGVRDRQHVHTPEAALGEERPEEVQAVRLGLGRGLQVEERQRPATAQGEVLLRDDSGPFSPQPVSFSLQPPPPPNNAGTL